MSATLLTAWEQTVRAAPDAAAVVEAATARIFTRREIDDAASTWCRDHGAGLAGRTVVLAERNGPEWLRVFLGVLKSGAVAVPLDPGEPIAAQHTIAVGLRAAGLWTENTLQRSGGEAHRARDARCLVKLTSGSTGQPRALVFTDAQMLADGRQVSAAMDIRSDDTNFGLIPFGHSYGLGNLVVPLLAQGTAIVVGDSALPHAIAAAFARWRPTVFPAVPALLRALALSDVSRGQLASCRTVISAGAALAPEVAEQFEARFSRSVHSFYGSSETGGISYDLRGDAARTGCSVGRPLPGVRLVFGRGRRFVVESAAVFTIGNRRRDATGCGGHQPADFGALTPTGELVLLGRAGRAVKIAGRRLDLAEVERALRALPGVRDAWVTSHGQRADALAAAVATHQSAAALREQLRERLAAWKIPKKILTLPELPLTERGKTDVPRLRALLEQSP